MKLTPLQKAIFLRVLAAGAFAGKWCRAESSGERVTFASLYRKGLFERQARRGNEGEADAAYEYRVPQIVRQLAILVVRDARNVVDPEEIFHRFEQKRAESLKPRLAEFSLEEQAKTFGFKQGQTK